MMLFAILNNLKFCKYQNMVCRRYIVTIIVVSVDICIDIVVVIVDTVRYIQEFIFLVKFENSTKKRNCAPGYI